MRTIDRNSPVPLHHQLRLALIESIEGGEFPPGRVFPTERELELRHGVSRITVRRSLQELAREGYVTRAPGKGTIVVRTKIDRGLSRLTSFAEEMRERGRQVDSRLLEFCTLPAPAGIAERLAVDTGTVLTFISRLRLELNQPIALCHSYLHLPAHLKLTAEELTVTHSLWALLDQKGLQIVEAEKTLEAIVADGPNAALLQVPVGAPLMQVVGVSYSRHHYALEYHQVINRADSYRYTLRQRR